MEEYYGISLDEIVKAKSVEATDIRSRILVTEMSHTVMCHTVMCHTVHIDEKSPIGARFFHFKTGKDQEWKVRIRVYNPYGKSYYNTEFALCLTNFPKDSPVLTQISLYGLQEGSMFTDFLPLDIKGCEINELEPPLPSSVKIEINVIEKVGCNDIEKETNKLAIERNDSPDYTEIIFNKDHDTTLFSSEWEYGCHKKVLVNSSPVFKAMFDHDLLENETGRVEIRDMEGPVVGSMLLYMYTGSCVGLEKYAGKLVYAANKYELKTLETACINHMVQNIVPDNALEMLNIADLCDNELLSDTAMRFIRLNFDKVVLTDGWKKLEQSNKSLCKILKMFLPPSDDKQKGTE